MLVRLLAPVVVTGLVLNSAPAGAQAVTQHLALAADSNFMQTAGSLGLLHQCRNRAPRLASLPRIDAIEAKHHGRVQHAAACVADLVRRAGKGREIAVAGTVDEDFRAHRPAPGF